jgi:hypothetical protein
MCVEASTQPEVKLSWQPTIIHQERAFSTFTFCFFLTMLSSPIKYGNLCCTAPDGDDCLARNYLLLPMLLQPLSIYEGPYGRQSTGRL